MAVTGIRPMLTRAKNHRRGFTLIELLIVISILSLLMALLGATLSKLREQTRRSSAKTQIERVYSALEQYHLIFRTYPPTTAPGGLSGDQALYYYLTTAFSPKPDPAKAEVWSALYCAPCIQNLQATEFRQSGPGYDFIDPWNQPLIFKMNVYADTTNLLTYSPLIYSTGPNKADEHTVFRPGATAGSGLYATSSSNPDVDANSDDIVAGK
jgi:prepilin-type N-terminal cleavage/methylation domain-containing protein